MHGILIALRDAKRREAFASTLARAGWPVAACADVEAAAQILGAEQTALLIGDARSLRGEEDDPDLLTAAGHRGLPCLLLGGIDAPDEDAAPAASCHVLPGDPDAQALLDAVRGLLPEPPAPPAAADGAEDDAEANAGDEAGDEAGKTVVVHQLLFDHGTSAAPSIKPGTTSDSRKEAREHVVGRKAYAEAVGTDQGQELPDFSDTGSLAHQPCRSKLSATKSNGTRRRNCASNTG